MATIHGMKKSWWDKLGQIMTQPHVDPPMTVAQYIERYNPETERRTTKRGTKLVKVHFCNGTVTEYEERFIDRISCPVRSYDLTKED